MLLEHSLPGFQVEFRQAASDVKPGTGRKISRTGAQTQLTATMRPGARRRGERQRGERPMLDAVVTLGPLQRHPQRGVAALAGRLAERRWQIDAQPL